MLVKSRHVGGRNLTRMSKAREVVLRRLVELIPYGDQERVTGLAGISTETVSRWRAGTEPSLDSLEALAAALRVSLADLITDREPLREPLPGEWEGYDWLPVSAEVGAGPGRDWQEGADETERRPFSHEQLAAWGGSSRMRLVRVAPGRYGQSMLPTIRPGARLLVQVGGTSASAWRDGEIYVVNIPDEGTVVKRVFRAEAHLLLWSDNPAHPQRSQRIEPEDGDLNRVVVGRVRWIGQEED